MKLTRTLPRALTAAAAVLAIGGLAGCAQGGTVAGQATASAATETAPETQDAQVAATTVNATDNPQLGQILTDGDGRTLYRFDKDTAKPSKSNCEGDCATAWPPLLKGDGEIQLTGVDASLVGTVQRADGSEQVTIAGWPLYRYANDSKPGDINGQGAGGSWFAATPQGKKAQFVSAGTTTPVALVVMKVGRLGQIITDREGMTLYRFDKDDPKKPKSNCEGDCAKTWLPLITQSDNIEVTGVDRSRVGTVTRADGSKQVTVAGWPVYRFSGDKVPCDYKGQGVGGTWFALTPEGKKAGV